MAALVSRRYLPALWIDPLTTLLDRFDHLAGRLVVQDACHAHQILDRGPFGEGVDEVVDQLESPLLKLWRQAVQIFQDLFFDSGLNHGQYLSSTSHSTRLPVQRACAARRNTGAPGKKIPVPISALRVSVS